MKSFVLATVLSLASAAASADDCWTYDASAKTLTHGSVVLQNVTASGKNLAIGNNQSNATATELDFSIPIDGGYQITSIGGQAFHANTHLETLITPTSLTYIAWEAFSDCTGLRKVHLAEGLETVQQLVFARCTSLSDFNGVPSTMTDMSSGMFNECTLLTGDIVIPAGVSSYGGRTFNGTGVSSITLLGATKVSGYGGYSSMPNLTTITLSTNLTTVGSDQRIFGDMGSHGGVPVAIYWRSCPTSIAGNLTAGTSSGVITHYLPWHLKAEWQAYAETTVSGTTPRLILPSTFAGTDGSWNTGSTQIVRWWKDPAAPRDGTVIAIY